MIHKPRDHSSRPADSARGSAIAQAGEVRSSRIESMRALAALAVLVGHVQLTALQAAADRHPDLIQKTLYGGGLGVFFFFALTGYLLFWPFVRRDFTGGDRVDVRRYAVNRALRILPLYYVVVIVVLAFRPDAGLSTWARFLTFTENFSSSTVSQFVGPAWSLVVELQFYVLLPLIAIVVARIARGSLMRGAALLSGVALVSFAFRYHYVYAPAAPLPVWRYNMPTTFLFFVPGMLLALVRASWEANGPPAWLRALPQNADAWLVATLPLYAVVALGSYDLDWLICAAAFLAVGACVLPLARGRLAPLLEWRGLAAVGVASYSLYLWHLPLIGLLVNHLAAPTTLVPLAAVAIPAALAVAVISYGLVERPFLRRRTQWSNAAAPKPATQLS